MEQTDFSSRGHQQVSMRRALLRWYATKKRDLPWRNDASPYAIWVSEVMLQQTRVEVVRDYFVRWMQSLPTLTDLARAEEEDVLKLWQGLGYYARARRLRKGAQYVVEHCGGALPQHTDELMQIPGIGPYSAGAISSIAFGQPAALVDGNVVRVLSRYFRLEGDPGRAPLKRNLWTIAQELVPKKAPGDFNQALMELGATLCTPKSPLCPVCPLRHSCAALSHGEVQRFPELPRREAPTDLRMVLLLLRSDKGYAVSRQGEGARWWQGLDAFPYCEVIQGQKAAGVARKFAHSLGLALDRGHVLLPEIRHTVTKYRITLLPVLFHVAKVAQTSVTMRWVKGKGMRDLALPAPHRRVTALLDEWEANSGGPQ